MEGSPWRMVEKVIKGSEQLKTAKRGVMGEEKGGVKKLLKRLGLRESCKVFPSWGEAD